jgi:hypothetical protein
MLAAARLPCFYESVFQQPGSFSIQQNIGDFSEVRNGKRRPSNSHLLENAPILVFLHTRDPVVQRGGSLRSHAPLKGGGIEK